MVEQFSEKQLLNELDSYTAHADEIGQPISAKIPHRSKLLEILYPIFVEGSHESPSSPNRDAKLVRKLLELGFTIEDLSASLGTPISTPDAPDNDFRLEEAQRIRLTRLLWILAWTHELFEGDTAVAVRWFTSPAKALGGETPAAMTGSDQETEAVRTVIGRIAHGIPQ